MADMTDAIAAAAARQAAAAQDVARESQRSPDRLRRRDITDKQTMNEEPAPPVLLVHEDPWMSASVEDNEPSHTNQSGSAVEIEELGIIEEKMGNVAEDAAPTPTSTHSFVSPSSPPLPESAPPMGTPASSSATVQTPVRSNTSSRPLVSRFKSWRQQASVQAMEVLKKHRSPTTSNKQTVTLDASWSGVASPLRTARLSPQASQEGSWNAELAAGATAASSPPPPPPPPPLPRPADGDTTTPPKLKVSFELGAASAANQKTDVGHETDEDDRSSRRSRSSGGGGTYDDDSDDRSSSSYFSSTTGGGFTSSEAGSGSSRAFSWAVQAANVMDSVQVMRGRYNDSNVTPRKVATSPATAAAAAIAAAPSQTLRILQSRQASHWQNLHASLQSHEYIMLLGRGMLGVNLKQCYCKHLGVYVDFLVPGGAAEQSGVMQVGDLLLQVGNHNVRHDTILHVPTRIATSPRPVHLVLATGSSPAPLVRRNYVDVCVALMHVYCEQDNNEAVIPPPVPEEKKEIVEELEEDGDSARASVTEDETPGTVVAKDSSPMMKLVQATTFDEKSNKNAKTAAAIASMEVECSDDSVEDFCRPNRPAPDLCKLLEPLMLQRGNASKLHNNFQSLVTACAQHVNFRHALHHAFLLCSLDARRFPFLQRQYSEQELDAMLVLLLEMIHFCDLFAMTPVARRKMVANRIAHKFFLPTMVDGDLIPPAFDFHYIVPDGALRTLEAALKDNDDALTRNVFLDFQKAVASELNGAPFLEFLTSDEGARMRAWLRNTAPYVNVPIDKVFAELTSTKNQASSGARNYLLYVLLYLVSQVEKEVLGENDDIIGESGPRMEGAAAGICGVLFICTRILPTMDQTRLAKATDEVAQRAVLDVFETFWEVYVAPGVGALERFATESDDMKDKIDAIRQRLEDIQNDHESLELPLIVERLLEPSMSDALTALAYELMYAYAMNVHTKFKCHKIHEWYAAELCGADCKASDIPALPQGCIKRLLRKADLPNGVSTHKPIYATSTKSEKCISKLPSAECAVLFGSVSTNSVSPKAGESIQRYGCLCIVDDDAARTGALRSEDLPPTLEQYATIPLHRQRPFAAFNDQFTTVYNDWELSLIDFMIPRATASETSNSTAENGIYGVSLLLQRVTKRKAAEVDSEQVPVSIKTESSDQSKPAIGPDAEDPNDRGDNNQLSPTSSPKTECPTHYDSTNCHVEERVSIGLALVSQHNVICSMRSALHKFVKKFTVSNGSKCATLVSLLENYTHSGADMQSLRCVLEPFVAGSSAPWLERPFTAQRDAHIEKAGHKLVQCLPPIPLALVFLTALLEQKIVLTSSRRSILLSSSLALHELLKPLQWCHLLVPRVPSSLAGDLLQYPAPFILGLPSEDPGMMELIRGLPQDVTLVDLDVGRVILAPFFAHTLEAGRATSVNDAQTAIALRSQTLFLAQSLGSIIGKTMYPDTWLCDSLTEHATEQGQSPWQSLKNVCHDFVHELLAGTTACCYWIEESMEVAQDSSDKAVTVEPTVLFDEDRFFHIKNARCHRPVQPLFATQQSHSMALSLDDFDLILEVFLRSQSMNAYVSSRPRNQMLFSF